MNDADLDRPLGARYAFNSSLSCDYNPAFIDGSKNLRASSFKECAV